MHSTRFVQRSRPTGQASRPGAAEETRSAQATTNGATGGGGMSIEMWRADDGGRAVLQRKLQRGVFEEFALER